jgi:hypothetical protein
MRLHPRYLKTRISGKSQKITPSLLTIKNIRLTEGPAFPSHRTSQSHVKDAFAPLKSHPQHYNQRTCISPRSPFPIQPRANSTIYSHPLKVHEHISEPRISFVYVFFNDSCTPSEEGFPLIFSSSLHCDGKDQAT